jgi:hypothetical protein
MVQTIIVDGKSYDLVPETLAIAKQIEDLEDSIYYNSISKADKISAMMEVIKTCIKVIAKI